MAFFNVSKALDPDPRELLWDILKRFECLDRIVSFIRSFHNNMRVRVSASGALSEEFEMTEGVKQGRVMAPKLFNVYMPCAMHLFYRKVSNNGVYICAR